MIRQYPAAARVLSGLCFPKTDKMLFLAGGLTADNVAAAICQVHPYAVDVSSGVELSDKSGKDYQLVQAFIKNAKSAIIH